MVLLKYIFKSKKGDDTKKKKDENNNIQTAENGVQTEAVHYNVQDENSLIIKFYNKLVATPPLAQYVDSNEDNPFVVVEIASEMIYALKVLTEKVDYREQQSDYLARCYAQLSKNPKLFKDVLTFFDLKEENINDTLKFAKSNFFDISALTRDHVLNTEVKIIKKFNINEDKKQESYEYLESLRKEVVTTINRVDYTNSTKAALLRNIYNQALTFITDYYPDVGGSVVATGFKLFIADQLIFVKNQKKYGDFLDYILQVERRVRRTLSTFMFLKSKSKL